MDGLKKISFFLLPVMAVMLISCGNNGYSRFSADNNIAFDTISMHERHHLDEDTSKPYCDIRLEFVYPAATSSYNTDTLQRFFVRHMFGTSYDSLTPALAADAYVKNFIENYSADAGIYRETEKDRMKLTELNSRHQYLRQ